jgi:hypothetical protein
MLWIAHEGDEMTKTYKGKTAGGILKTAKVGQTKAGTTEVFVTVAGREMVADLTERGNLVLCDGGQPVFVATSDRAESTLRSLAKAGVTINSALGVKQ